jgi:hypothetical protein
MARRPIADADNPAQDVKRQSDPVLPVLSIAAAGGGLVPLPSVGSVAAVGGLSVTTEVVDEELRAIWETLVAGVQRCLG